MKPRARRALAVPSSTHAVTLAAISTTTISTTSTSPLLDRGCSRPRTVGAPTSTPLAVIPAGTIGAIGAIGATMFTVAASFPTPPPPPPPAPTTPGATTPIGTVFETTRLLSSGATTPPATTTRREATGGAVCCTGTPASSACRAYPEATSPIGCACSQRFRVTTTAASGSPTSRPRSHCNPWINPHIPA